MPFYTYSLSKVHLFSVLCIEWCLFRVGEERYFVTKCILLASMAGLLQQELLQKAPFVSFMIFSCENHKLHSCIVVICFLFHLKSSLLFCNIKEAISWFEWYEVVVRSFSSCLLAKPCQVEVRDMEGTAWKLIFCQLCKNIQKRPLLRVLFIRKYAQKYSQLYNIRAYMRQLHNIFETT